MPIRTIGFALRRSTTRTVEAAHIQPRTAGALHRSPVRFEVASGVYKGRPPVIDPGNVRELKALGLGASAIAKQLKIGRASVYRVPRAGCRLKD